LHGLYEKVGLGCARRKGLREAYKVQKVGRRKYEVDTRYGARKSRKLIVVEYHEEIFIMTGARAGTLQRGYALPVGSGIGSTATVLMPNSFPIT